MVLSHFESFFGGGGGGGGGWGDIWLILLNMG